MDSRVSMDSAEVCDVRADVSSWAVSLSVLGSRVELFAIEG